MRFRSIEEREEVLLKEIIVGVTGRRDVNIRIVACELPLIICFELTGSKHFRVVGSLR